MTAASLTRELIVAIVEWETTFPVVSHIFACGMFVVFLSNVEIIPVLFFLHVCIRKSVHYDRYGVGARKCHGNVEDRREMFRIPRSQLGCMLSDCGTPTRTNGSVDQPKDGPQRMSQNGTTMEAFQWYVAANGKHPLRRLTRTVNMLRNMG